MTKYEKLCHYIDVVVAELAESETHAHSHHFEHCASMYHDMRTGCEMIKNYKEALLCEEEDD